MLKQYVLEHIKPDTYYAKRFPEWNLRYHPNVRCPFHEDHQPSLSVNLKNGGAKCHSAGCGRSFGNIIHFEGELKKVPEILAARKLYAEFIRPVLSHKLVAQFRDVLSCNTEYLLRIRKEMGLTYSGIKRFSLGLDLETKRITIPIFDRFGQCINIRYYLLPSLRDKKSVKIYNHEKGYGRCDLFSWNEVGRFKLGRPIFWLGAEKEVMLGTTDGLCCLCSTTGEDSWNDSWNSIFEGRDVFIVQHKDVAGHRAGEKIQERVTSVANSVQIVELPFRKNRPDWKDYADWRLREHHSAEELEKLIALRPIKRRQRVVDSPSSSDIVSESVMDSSLQSTRGIGVESAELDYPKLPKFASKSILDIASISSRSDLLNKRIKTQGIVAAKSPNTFSIPWKFKITLKNRPSFEFIMPMDRELLRFVRASDSKILQSLQRLVGSDTSSIEPLAYLTATQVEIIPTAAADRDVPYAVQRCYYFGERIEANVPYLLDIIPTSEIRTQETIGIITSIIPLSKSIDKFDLTPEVQANLSAFWPTDGETVWEKLLHIANEIANHHTHVYNRLDWHMVALLTWASPIGWRFPDELDLQRGWINSLAIGDTETGKSKVAKALQQVFKTGVFVNAENCTFVGLVGGAIKMGSGQLMLRWGRIPLSDKQLVILEELAGLSIEEISSMSDVRSSGIARLDKGGINSETNARTRLLCLSNIRSKTAGRNLSGYLFGVRAVQELIGHSEDIARFDLIITLVDKEVSIAVINDPDIANVAKLTERTVSTDQLQQLIHFIWSLTPEQIYFTRKAYVECLDQTKRLSAIYHPSIPIFKGGSGRYKLGRIAASIACFQFAWNDDRKAIRVSHKHVETAAKLLEQLYNRPSLGYAEFSRNSFDRETVKDKDLLWAAFKEIPKEMRSKVIDGIIYATRFTRDELCALAGLTLFSADRFLGTLYRERAIEKGDTNIWIVTPAGKAFMETIRK